MRRAASECLYQLGRGGPTLSQPLQNRVIEFRALLMDDLVEKLTSRASEQFCGVGPLDLSAAQRTRDRPTSATGVVAVVRTIDPGLQ